MVDKWTNLTSDDLFQFWPDSWFTVLEDEPSLLDSTPLLNFIKNVLEGKEFKRKLITGAVDVDSGRFITMDSDQFTPEEWPYIILGSASVPFAFPPTKLRDWHLMDGGTTWNINIISAIEECRKVVEKDSDIILDLVLLITEHIE